MAQENSEKSGGGLGCLSIITIIAIIGAAAYFAHYKNAQFPGAETIRTITQKTAEMESTWLHEDPSTNEAKAAKWLRYINHTNPQAAAKITGMPFLKSVSSTDVLLLKGLYYQERQGSIEVILNHPALPEGITDDETVLITAATASNDPRRIKQLLYPGNATTETIRTSSPRTPKLSISIVRTGNRTISGTSLVIEDAVKYVENTMGMALPTDHVILLLDDTGVTEGFAGTNYGQAIAYLKKGESGTEWDRTAFKKGLVHEVAHYFWRGNENWIDEGMAETIEQSWGIKNKLPGEMMRTETKGCTLSTLQELSSLKPDQKSPQFYCNYYLGRRLFAELQGTMDEEEFRLSLKELYAMNKALDEKSKHGGIGEVRTAFPKYEGIIEKHWSGQQLMALSPPAPTDAPEGIGAITLPPSIERRLAPTAVHTKISTPAPLKTMLTPAHPKTLLTLGTYSSLPTPALPTPTPTPVPPNIHAKTINRYSYSMELPPGWTSKQESDGRTTFLSPRGTAGAAIHIWRIDSDDAASLFKEHLDKLLERMRTTVGTRESGIFEMKPPRPLPAAVTKHLWQARQMEYRRRESPDQCIRDVVDIISPSNWHTHGVLIIAWTCEKHLDERAETERQKILTSFREKTVR